MIMFLGFNNMDAKVGFDLDAAKLILCDLAKLQGTAIGLKLQQPNVFIDKIKDSCAPFNFYAKEMKRWIEPIKLILQENLQCAPMAELATSFLRKKPSAPREPYATITHCDLWVENTMQMCGSGKVVKNKFVDFQLCDYRSCASDVFFFLWTSVQQSVLAEHLDNLIIHYHDILMNTLQKLNCDISVFSISKFYDELELEARYEFGHALLFAFLSKNTVLDEMIEDGSINESINSQDVYKRSPSSVKEFLWYMTKECNRRGWLY